VTPTGAGRFAPSPSADLHIGNLRTAVLAWLFARSTGRRFLMRVDDLDDRTHTDIGLRQLDDLAAIGLTWDEPAQWQTEHPQRYDEAVAGLAERGLLYECYCSRKDIQQAPRAPHAPLGAYPGTCRDLTDTDPVTGVTDGLLRVAAGTNTVPKIFYTNTSNEYWRISASLLHTTMDGATEAPLAPTTRIYYLAGTQHGAGAWPPPRAG